MKNNYIILVSVAVGRKRKDNRRDYEVRERIEGLTPKLANEIYDAFHGRLQGVNRVDVVQEGNFLADLGVGRIFTKNEYY